MSKCLAASSKYDEIISIKKKLINSIYEITLVYLRSFIKSVNEFI